MDWVEDGLLDEASRCHPLLRDLVVEDLEILRDFYERGPRPAAEERRTLGLSGTVWVPDQASPLTANNSPRPDQGQGWLVPPESFQG